MGKAKWHHLPRGTHQRPEGKRTDSVGKTQRCMTIFFMWGTILFWTLCPIRSEAAASDQEEIPKEIIEYCEEIGPTYDICPELLEAIAWHESRFTEDVTNKNCWGLCQVNIKIHADRIENLGYTKKDMLKARPNIEVAADYLHELYETYGDDNPIILSLYS